MSTTAVGGARWYSMGRVALGMYPHDLPWSLTFCETCTAEYRSSRRI